MRSFAVKAILLLGVQRPHLLGVCTSKGHKMSFPLLQKQLKNRGEKIKIKIPSRSENLGRSRDSSMNSH